MSSSSNWLATLQRIREHRRDTALQSLARSLQAATQIRDAATSVEAMISSLGQAKQQSHHAKRLDSERMRQTRQVRDDLRSQRTDLLRQQVAADDAVRQAQTNAAAKEAEADALRRLQDRLDSAHRQAQRRRDEQTPLEIAASLCNRNLSD